MDLMIDDYKRIICKSSRNKKRKNEGQLESFGIHLFIIPNRNLWISIFEQMNEMGDVSAGICNYKIDAHNGNQSPNDSFGGDFMSLEDPNQWYRKDRTR